MAPTFFNYQLLIVFIKFEYSIEGSYNIMNVLIGCYSVSPLLERLYYDAALFLFLSILHKKILDLYYVGVYSLFFFLTKT